MILAILAVLFVVTLYLEYHDYHTTVKILDNGGQELNPAMRWLLDTFGYKAMAVSKFIYIGVVLGAIIFNPSWWTIAGIGAVAAVMAWAVTNNQNELVKMGIPYESKWLL